MFADLELVGLEFDASILECYLGACLAVAGVVFLFNKLTAISPYSTGVDAMSPVAYKSLSTPAPSAEPRPTGWEAPAPEPPPVAATKSAPARARSNPRDRRRSLRRGGKPVKVLLSDPASGAAPIICWVIDRSRGGLGLIVPRPLSRGAVLGVKACHGPEDLAPVQVEVRNCRRKGHRWMVGCRFTSELPWTVLLLFG